MKYFTKYLPVEGEIQPNSWVQSPNDGEIWQLNGTKDAVGFAIESMQQLVKLFLCSRYIQVGDKVIGKLAAVFNYEELVVEELYEDGAMLGKPSEKYLAPSNDFFKVIGEISPEATWVKEGGEFDEKDLAICWDRTFLPLNTIFDVGKGEIKFDKIIAVKSPCGHFH